MSDRGLRRRTFLGAGLAAALSGPWVLRHPRAAEAGPEEDGVVKAAKKRKPADLNGMIWSLYYRNMQRLSDEFRVDIDRAVGELRMAFGHEAVLL